MKYLSIENFWKLSHLIFLFLIGLSIYYAIERVCYVDSAFMLFRMINQESFIAEGGRYMNVLPQFIPWIFIKLGLPLKMIIICFSCMHIVVLYLIFQITGNFFKQKFLAVLFLLLLIVSVNETFFDVVTETKFSLAFGILFSAFLFSPKNNLIFVGIVILICGFFSHPVFIIYFGVIILSFRIFKPQTPLLKFLISGVAIFMLKYLTVGATTYENNLITSAFSDLFLTFKNSFIHHYFSGLFTTPFIFLIILLLIIIYHLTASRKYFEVMIYLAGIFITYFLLSIVYSKGDSHMMIQKTLILFHFILIYPIAFLWQQLSPILLKSVLLIFLISTIFALAGIHGSAAKYVDRVSILNDFMQKIPATSDKFLIREEQINHDKLLATWALSHETIMLSQIYLKKNLSIKNFRERNDTLLFSKFPNAFRPTFGYPMLNKDLNQGYFKIDESKPNLWLDSSFILGER